MSNSMNVITAIKWLAVVSMTMDHLAVYLLEGTMWYIPFRTLGRFAFPAFCWLLAVNYARAKSQTLGWSPVRYAFRMLIAGIITQSIVFPDRITLNVLFTLTLGLVFIDTYSRCQHLLMLGTVVVLALFAPINILEYTLLGAFLPLAFYIAVTENKLQWLPAAVLVPIVFISPAHQSAAVIFCVVLEAYSTKAVRWTPWPTRSIFSQYAFYVYYPTHLVILMSVGRLIS